MAVRYEFCCSRCGVFELALPMGEAPQEASCGSCGSPSSRRYLGAAVVAGTSPLAKAREAAERSAHQPAVTRREHAARREPERPDPRHTRLPRP